ncbi:hypothetical protein MNB_SV-4-306 [hydrothermal vent metagenome]|uniref:Uncharacterized protein n=1 Tax=hydrothermal vent metagenome TaxID=652676 RepID=A0A1W1E8E6_9ZZZZ
MQTSTITLKDGDLIILAMEHASWDMLKAYSNDEIAAMAKEVIISKVEKAKKEIIESCIPTEKEKAIYPSAFVSKAQEIEEEPEFKRFADEVMKRLDAIAEQNNALSEQNRENGERIESMHAAFDMIFKDYSTPKVKTTFLFP